MSSTVVVHVSYRAQPDKADLAAREIASLVGEVRSAEPDCLGISIDRGDDDPARFVLRERWTSREAYLGPHMQTAHLRSFVQRAPEFLTGPPDISFWHEIDHATAATGLRPREVVEAWVEAFNRGDADALAAFYSEEAINHQVAEAPVRGREAIRAMFAAGFAAAEMTCIVENLFEDGEWAMLEWRDPLGLRGCGFFHVVDGRIVFQRGYWDKLTLLRQQGLTTTGSE
jgi:quinol monooxygenase YgiN/limonene-1,2-epoxide hydrolase